MSEAVAIVVGLDLNGLGVARSLGGAGVSVIALETDLAKPACATRHVTLRQIGDISGPALVEALMRLGEELTDPAVLFLTQEASVFTVSRERERLQAVFRFSMPPDDVMRKLLDKLTFQTLAEGLGFAIPRAARLTRGAAADAIEALRFPCILKPATKDPEYGKRFRKAYKVAGPKEALDLWREISQVIPEVIVQEWIDGGDADVYFCLQYRPPAGAATSFVGRKLRQWPVLVGGTACCVPAPEAAEELTATTNRFFAAVGFTGLCSMEYKRDRRDGRYYMVEPTVGRTDYQEEIATLNGVNIPYAAYCGELGLPAPEAHARKPRGWRDAPADARARAATEFSPPAGVPIADALWRPGDPMPSLREFAGRIGHRLSPLLQPRTARA